MYLSKEELIAKIQDIEWDDFEAKASKTQLPVDTWRTVSAFSNTSGGWILCGVAQHGKKFEIEGIENGEKIENDFLTTIRKLFRYAKLSENAGYGIDKIYSWERLTGEKVEFASDLMSTTVTYWRPKVGSSVKRGGKAGEVSNETNPKTNPKNRKEKGPELRTKMIRIMRATPTISRQELADLCNVNLAGIKYHLRILKDEMGIHWDGASKTGHWVFPE